MCFIEQWIIRIRLSIIIRRHYNVWFHNINMQIKQLKSLINAHYLSPWSDQLDLDQFLAPPQQYNHPISEKQHNQSHQNHNEGKEKTIEQQAKKTLLNIDIDRKHKKADQLKIYLNRKGKMKINSISSQDNNQFRLPPIHKNFNSIDYYNNYIINNQYNKATIEELDLFRKYGDHRSNRQRDMKERSMSIGQGIPQYLQGSPQKKYKMESLDPLPFIDKSTSTLQVKDLRLKGKKYSFDSRIQSERKLNSDKYTYIPSQPNITPHYLLFGHNKQDVLKKVLKQINQKVK